MKNGFDQKTNIEVLLRKTSEDEVKNLSLRQLRKLIKEVDDVILPEDARVYDRLHSNIMSNIMAALETDESYAAAAFTLGAEVRREDMGHRLLSWSGLWRRLTAE